MSHKVTIFQKRALDILSHKIDDFYLAGGTALSLYYFNHRESLDLYFFTKHFNRARVLEIIKFLEESLRRKIKIIAEQPHKNRIRIIVCTVPAYRNYSLKIDFVEDYLDCIKPFRIVNGIRVLSLEDIYIRKIYTLIGTKPTEDSIGRIAFKGGRQEAKDFYDVYCLSQVFIRLSDFSWKFGNPLIREGIIRWFSSYDRADMKTGLLELRLKKAVNYNDIERHFKKEVDRIIEREIDFI